MHRPELAKSWIEISKTALLSNYQLYKERISSGASVMPVVKANAYGHGLVPVAKTLWENDSELRWLAVDRLEEAIVLRKAGWTKSILVLGYIPQEGLEGAMKESISFVLFHEDILESIRAIAKDARINIHIPIETGLHREGIELEDLPRVLKMIASMPQVHIEGVQMHFANIEDTSSRAYADHQLMNYQKALEIFKEQNIDSFIKHGAASAAAILYSDTHFDLIRLGIALYGLWPSDKTKKQTHEKNSETKLKPVLTWKTIIAQVKPVKAGEPVSYGLTECVEKDSTIAVLPIGYADGFDRVSLSSRGEVLVKGKRCKVIGRICMNMCMVDVTEVSEIKEEDEVVLIGAQGDEVITAEELAGEGEMINYEIVTRINAALPRVVVD